MRCGFAFGVQGVAAVSATARTARWVVARVRDACASSGIRSNTYERGATRRRADRVHYDVSSFYKRSF
ncbi:MAG: hypothetical protein ACE5E6_06085 [Phycisphaerae bacterium]